MNSDHLDLDVSPNGPAAAAILATGIGCATLGVLAFGADALPALGRLLNIYNPTGTLSGVTTAAIIVWLLIWFLLHRFWCQRSVSLAKINVYAFMLLAAGFLLTCPPVMDLLQGK